MKCCMASACATSKPLVSAPSSCPSSKKTAARCRVSCRATGGGGRDSDLWLPRRDVLLSGLSGAAAGLAWYPGLASGQQEDTSCQKADLVTDKVLQCTNTDTSSPCPLPSNSAPLDFTPAAGNKVTRVRQAAHLLSRENQEKYKEAVARMKALPESNPLSFAAQANIHGAYCDSFYSYRQHHGSNPAFTGVHFSWLFVPWHRMYLYFYERALGQLIGDDTFALPYWNWDAPAGMGIPPIFKSGSLYDVNRNPLHIDALVNLASTGAADEELLDFDGPKDERYMDAVNVNLCTVYNQQVTSGRGALAFLGDKYCTTLSGMTSQGSAERMAHTAVHGWVGKAGPPAGTTCSAETGGFLAHDGTYSCVNDMGFLGSSGWDPLFYSHHCNIDRLWHIWATRLGGGQGFTDPDWLDTTFVFYDDVENPRRVRIKFSDILSTSNLGYTYDPENDKNLPWLRCKIRPLVPHGKDSPAPAPRSKAASPVFPLTLTKGQVVVVPAVPVPAAIEPGKELVLVIDGIEYYPQEINKFDVAINVPADKALQVGPQYREYAGSFAVVPSSGGGGTQQGKLSLCIDDVLNGIDADSDSTVDVVIVPRTDAKVTLNVAPIIQVRDV